MLKYVSGMGIEHLFTLSLCQNLNLGCYLIVDIVTWHEAVTIWTIKLSIKVKNKGQTKSVKKLSGFFAFTSLHKQLEILLCTNGVLICVLDMDPPQLVGQSHTIFLLLIT